MRKCHGVPPEFLCTMFMVEFSTLFIELLIHNVANLMQFISDRTGLEAPEEEKSEEEENGEEKEN